MRHKKRPIKSSRHKSLTFIIDSHTSFGEPKNESNRHNLKPIHLLPVLPQTSLSSQQQHSRVQRSTATTSSAYDSHRSGNGTSGKQFEHNYTHMSDVMRLAFLENNDISVEDSSKLDFNSLSTSILQRNIQHQLQQERREQQQRQQEQQLQLQQLHLIQRQRQGQQHIQEQHQQQQHLYQFHNRYEVDDDLVEDYDNTVNNYDDSRIFATATGKSNNSSKRINLFISSPKAGQRQHHQQQLDFQHQQPSGSNVEQQHEIVQNYGEGFLCDEPDCGKSFPSLRKLRHHKVVHSDEFPFVCEFNGCGKKFKRKFGIDLHSTTHFDLDPVMYTKTSNNSSLPFFGRRMQYSMCKPCGQKFKTVHEYQYHMLKHGKEPFKCPVKGCGQTFGIWKSFQKHRASHYFNYYCKMDSHCDHHTSNLQLLKLHIYCCHFRRKLPENATLSSRDRDLVEDENVKGEHTEVLDTDDFSHHEEHQEEKYIVHDVQQEQGNEERDEEDEHQHQLDTESSEPCTPVQTPRRDSRLRKNPPRSSTFGQQDYASINNGISFAKTISSTPQHKKTRAVSKQQQQQQQPIQQPQQQHISQQSQQQHLQHLQQHHQQDEQDQYQESPSQADLSPVLDESVGRCGEGFLCDEPDCGKSFPSLRKLRHHKVVHSDEFPFVCEFNGCGKKFKRKFGIDLHSTTHFDLDPVMYTKTSNNSSLPFFGRRMQYSMCKPCGQKFKTVHEYQYHMLKHGKEPFKCPVKGCGQTFGIWKSFQKHRASHYFNYYCKMDSHCDHHTSNLQLLKLHIYCCHFRRKLPENATLSSRDRDLVEDESDKVEHSEVLGTDELSLNEEQQEEEDYHDHDADQEHLHEVKQEDEQQQELDSGEAIQRSEASTPLQTPRRDSRLRKNPPRSSTFGQQDYASINNGSSFAKSINSTPQQKRTRTSFGSSGSQGVTGGQSASSPKKKAKLPLKILPKRSAQRVPISLLAADDASSEDERHSSGEERLSIQNDKDEDEQELEHDSHQRGSASRFKCHLCDYKFSVRFQLTKHLSTHLELNPDMYSKTADKQVVALSERRRREFYCDKCRLKFEHMQGLDEHMQKKHGQRPYVCHFCQVPSTFSIAKQYLSHLYEHRFNYRCTMTPDCDFTINRKDALKLHIFRMHLNQQLPSYIEDFANLINSNDEWIDE